MKIQVLTPEQVKAAIERHRNGQTMPQLAASLGMSRSQLYQHIQEGVQLDVSKNAQTLLEAAGVEIVAKKRGKS